MKIEKPMDEMKKKVKTAEAVGAYNVLKGLKISGLTKEDQFAVLRAARSLKAVATAVEDFVKDVRERLRPEDFDGMESKRERFQTLSEVEKRELNARYISYQKDIDDCVDPELESVKEIDAFVPLSDDALSIIASTNKDIDLEALMLIQDVCG